jgi:hypothetical protein
MARDPKQPVNFRDWTEVLAGTVLPWDRRTERVFLSFVHFLRFLRYLL